MSWRLRGLSYLLLLFRRRALRLISLPGGRLLTIFVLILVRPRVNAVSVRGVRALDGG